MRLRSIIGKRAVWAAAAVCGALLLAVLFWLQAKGMSASFRAGLRAQEAQGGLNEYAFDLIFRPGESALAVTMTLAYTNRTGDTLQDLVLRTWAGAYSREETSPAAIDALFDACYGDGFSAGGVAVEGVWWNDVPALSRFDDEAQTVLRVSIPPLADGEKGRLLLRCRLQIPACGHRFGHAQGIWQFGNALPILSVYEQGAWRTDPYSPIGDPFVSECANYTLSLVAPQGYSCAATGIAGQSGHGDGNVRFTLQARAVREFAFALSDQWRVAEERVQGIQVRAFAPTDAAAKRAAAYAGKALRAYAALYGDYPYAALTVCGVDFPFGGMEYPGLLFLGLSSFREGREDSLELLIAHETAHQWFYALVGSDQANDPWQDEALCEYAMLRYVRGEYGEGAYENLRITRVDAPMRERVSQHVTPGSPIGDFAGLDVYSAVVYGRGAAFLLAVEEMTGRLDSFLRAYCDVFAFRLASREDFAGLLNEFTGEDLSPLMADYLDTII